MTAVPVADFSARPLEFRRRSQAGEQIEIVQDGRPAVRLTPAINHSDADETGRMDPRELLLGIAAPEKPLDTALPSNPIPIKRRQVDISLAWLPEHDDDE